MRLKPLEIVMVNTRASSRYGHGDYGSAGCVTRQEGGGMSGSMRGNRGSEDLGGGLSANVDLSSFIRNDTGQSGRADILGGDL